LEGNEQGTTTIETRETHQAPCMALAESGEPHSRQQTPALEMSRKWENE
jgi:hypothetical protein